MPRFFMHLRDGTDEVLDPDGVEMPAEAVSGYTLATARDCMANDIRTGTVSLKHRIDVHDEGGQLVHSLAFTDAVLFVRVD
ncbi:MAG TPA: hypothetical protein VIA98_14290 [Allosphingosinicella sp.]